MPRSSLVGAISLLALPCLAILGCALLAEYGLEATNYGGWLAPWGAVLGLANLATFAVVLVAFSATPLLLAILANSPPPPRAILPGAQPGAATDGSGPSLAVPEAP